MDQTGSRLSTSSLAIPRRDGSELESQIFTSHFHIVRELFMRTVICACFVLLTFAAAVRAQSAKPWIEWTRKDVEKTLNDSAWGQTQTEGGQRQPENTSAITATTAARREDSNISAASKAESGEVKPSTSVKYHAGNHQSRRTAAVSQQTTQRQRQKSGALHGSPPHWTICDDVAERVQLGL